MMSENLIPIVLFITIGGVIALNFYFRNRTRQAVQQTVRAAIEKGQQLTPEVLEGLTDSLNSRNGDLRRGVISLTIGIAIFAFGMLLGEEDATAPLTAIAAFPVLIGIAYLGLWFFLKRKQD
jgi:hypothetical protein